MTHPPGRHRGPPTVTAVLLVRRPDHLALVLAALSAQTRPPDHAVGVDASENLDVVSGLHARLGDVVRLDASATTGDAVTAALAVADADALQPAPHETSADSAAFTPAAPTPAAPTPAAPTPAARTAAGREPAGQPRPAQAPAAPAAPTGPEHPDELDEDRQWIWVLDDRSVPAPDVLAELLAVAERSPRVALAGCKQRGGRDGRQLLEAGSTTSRWGRRITGVEPGELDQGQLDSREDVLAVSPSGMLVRRDVWELLGGSDPTLPDIGADQDLGRRVHLAGYRVVVVPDAVMTRLHPAAPAAPLSGGGKRASPVHAHPAGPVRRDAAYLRLVAASRWTLPLVALSVLVGAFARFALAMAAKEPRRAVASLAGALSALSRPRRVLWARRRSAHTSVVAQRDLRRLHAGAGEVGRWHRHRLTARPGHRRHRGRRSTLLDDPATAGHGSDHAPSEAVAGWSAVALVAALAAVSGVALSGVPGPGVLTADALPPLPETFGELWTASRSGWVAAGAGHAEPAAPFLSLLAALSLLAGGSPPLAAAALLLAAVPLAGLGGWWAAGALTRRPGRRVLAGLVWSAAPPLLLAVGDGRLGAVAVHLALPVALRCLASAALVRDGRAAWCWAGAGALTLVPVVTGAPVLLVPMVLGCLVVAVLARRGCVLAATLPALAAMAPTLAASITVSRAGSRSAAALPAVDRDGLVLPPDPGPAAASSVPSSWELALGWPAEPGVWVGLADIPVLEGVSAASVGSAAGAAVLAVLAAVPLLLAALAVPVAVRAGRVPRAVRWGLALAVVGLAVAVLASRTVLLPGSDPAVTAWPGAGTSLLALGLLTAGLAGAYGLPGGGLRARRAGAAGVAVLVVLPVLALVAWSAAGVAAPQERPRRDAGPTLPAVVVDTATSPDQIRVLALRATADGALAVSLLRGDGPGYESAGPGGPGPDAADAALRRAAVDLVSGGADPRAGLASFGVGAVVLLSTTQPAGSSVGGDPVARAANPAQPLTTPALTATLDATAGLTPSGQVDGLQAWRVEGRSGPSSTTPDRPAALRVVRPDGAQTAVAAQAYGASTTLADGAADRVLALAERVDDGWTATLDGRALRSTTVDGWAQGWQLPSAGGRLEVFHDDEVMSRWYPVQVVLLGLAAVAALPVRPSRTWAPAQSQEPDPAREPDPPQSRTPSREPEPPQTQSGPLAPDHPQAPSRPKDES